MILKEVKAFIKKNLKNNLKSLKMHFWGRGPGIGIYRAFGPVLGVFWAILGVF